MPQKAGFNALKAKICRGMALAPYSLVFKPERPWHVPSNMDLKGPVETMKFKLQLFIPAFLTVFGVVSASGSDQSQVSVGTTERYTSARASEALAKENRTAHPIRPDLKKPLPFLKPAATLILKTSPRLEKVAKGGSDTGGGNICKLDSKYELLELADLPSAALKTKSTRLRVTRTMRSLGIDRVELAKTSALKQALAYADAIRAASPRTSVLLIRAIKNIHFYGTDATPKASIRADFTDQPMCDQSNTIASIIYHAGSAVILVPLFNKLSLRSQAALLIHESLRRIQFDYNGQGSDLELQRVTRSIIDDHTEPLDQHQFFLKLLGRDEELISVWAEVCARFESLKIQNTLRTPQSLISLCDHNISDKNVSVFEQQLIANLSVDIEHAISASTDPQEIRRLAAATSEIAFLATHVGQRVFRGQTNEISTDHLQALQYSLFDWLIDTAGSAR